MTRLTVPLAMTLLRLVLVPVFLWLLAHGDAGWCRWSAIGLFGFMSITDNLDGRLARRWNQVTPLGAMLDPAADKVLVSFAVLLLAFPRFAPAGFSVPIPLVVGIYTKDVGVLIGIAVVKRINGRVMLAPNRYGKISTTAQLTLVIATLLAPDWVAVSPRFAGTLLWFVWQATVVATAAAGITYAVEGARQIAPRADGGAT